MDPSPAMVLYPPLPNEDIGEDPAEDCSAAEPRAHEDELGPVALVVRRPHRHERRQHRQVQRRRGVVRRPRAVVRAGT